MKSKNATINLTNKNDRIRIFNETSLPRKEDFYSHLNIEEIAAADYEYAKVVCKDF